MKLSPLTRMTPAQVWQGALRPRVAWIAMLLSALAAGWAMQLSIDRLTAAADARARLERQSSQLDRFQSGAAATPALQALRASHDDAVQKAASQSRWIVWGSLAWMAGVGMASVLTLQRRSRSDRSGSTAPGSSAAGPVASSHPAPAAIAEVTAATEAADRQWQSLRQEIEALRVLMDAPDPGPLAEKTTATHPGPTAAVVGRIEPVSPARPPFELLERSTQLELRLAA